MIYPTVLCWGLFPSFLLQTVLLRTLRFIHFLFQDERALPKGDFFPPERPQQLPREYFNYYGRDLEFVYTNQKTIITHEPWAMLFCNSLDHS